MSESPETPSERDGAASLWARLALVAGPLAGLLGAWVMTQGGWPEDASYAVLITLWVVVWWVL